jgi:muramoyltetrapeptide carboxypeptidase
MARDKVRIGVVAPASRLPVEIAERVSQIASARYGDRAELVIHPQCFLASGHFAGDDEARAKAFLEVANDPGFDALWFARGGYGSGRIIPHVLPLLGTAARQKTYLGYSDAGALLGAMYSAGFSTLAHGPMPADLLRENGESAVRRGLAFLVERAADALEATVSTGDKNAAFNITILGHLLGTPWQPDLSGHILMLEDVGEYMYRIDRALMHLTSAATIRKVEGIRLGRVSAIPANDPEFGQDEEQVMRHWCEVAGVAYLGRADIGHDVDNKVVPFGRLA